MGSFSLCVENTARDVQSLLTLHKVHPKVCIDVRRRMDQLIEKSYEEMEVLEPGYGESSYDICHAIAKTVIKQTLEVRVPQSELASTERRVAEKDQTIFELRTKLATVQGELEHANTVAAESKKAHEFMLHTYFREVLILRQQLEDLRKKQLAHSLQPSKQVGFPRFTRPNTGAVSTPGPSNLEDSSEDGRLTAIAGSDGDHHDFSGRQESPMEELSVIGKGADGGTTMAFSEPTGIRSALRSSANTRNDSTVILVGRVGGGGVGRPNVDPHNAIFDYEVYISMMKASQIDYEARYKALLTEREDMLKRHREARVKSMLDSKATLEESKFMIDELSKQLEASRAVSLMSDYKLRTCTEPIKENLLSLLNEIRMDVHHMQDEYAADMQRMSTAVQETQHRSDALQDFILTYVQAIAQLVVIVYEDASAKTDEGFKNDPFTEIGYILPHFFTVGDNEKRVKPMVKMEEAERGHTVSACGERPSSIEGGKRKKRKAKVSITDPSDPPKDTGEEDRLDTEVVITDPEQLYDASAAKFWSDNPISRNAQAVLSEFQALAMQLRSRKEILLQQKELRSRSGTWNEENFHDKRVGGEAGRPLSGRKKLHSDRQGSSHGKRSLPAEIDVLEIDAPDFDIAPPRALAALGGSSVLRGSSGARQSVDLQGNEKSRSKIGRLMNQDELDGDADHQLHNNLDTSYLSNSGRRRQRKTRDDDDRSISEAHLSVVDTSGLLVIYKKQVEMLQEHVKQLQQQILEQHDQLLRYYNEQQGLLSQNPSGARGSKSSSLCSAAPPTPYLGYLPPPHSPEFALLSPSVQKQSITFHQSQAEEDDSLLQTTQDLSAHNTFTSSAYQRMIKMALENKDKKSQAEAELLSAQQSHPALHPYFLQEPPKGWRCPLCKGYFTMEEAMQALEDTPAPVTTLVPRLRQAWMDRPINGCEEFATCRELLMELRRLRYKRVATQYRWRTARTVAGPVIYSPNTIVIPSIPTTPLGVVQNLFKELTNILDRTSKRITSLLLHLKRHVTNETEMIETVTLVPKQVDIMESAQEKRTPRQTFKSSYLYRPIKRKKKAETLTIDEEEDDEEVEERVEAAPPELSNWIMELDGRKIQINSYWSEPLRDQAKKRDEAIAAELAHQRALKKRGMFQSPYGAVAGYCTGVQQGIPAREAHRGPVYLEYDYKKDRYFITNEFGHAALEQQTTSDHIADSSGPPPATVQHPAEAPSAHPFTMTQILVPAPLSMLPPPYNQLAFSTASGGATVSDGFVIFTDPDSKGGAAKTTSHRPTSSPGPREAQRIRQQEVLQPVYMIPMTVPMEKSEFAYHGYGRTRDAPVYKLHGQEDSVAVGKDSRSRSGAAVEHSEDSSSSAASVSLPPLPTTLRSTTYGMLMGRNPSSRIVSSYAVPPTTASSHALQNPPRVARPRNAEQDMFRIQPAGGSGADAAPLFQYDKEENEELLSPREKVASALARAKRLQAIRQAQEQRSAEELREQRQAEWNSRMEVPEPIDKEKFLRLRLPRMASLQDLPDPKASVKMQKKLATHDLLGPDKVKKPIMGGKADTCRSDDNSDDELAILKSRRRPTRSSTNPPDKEAHLAL